MSAWDLPTVLSVGGKTYKINTDYRDILEIISYMNDESKPLALRWRVAVSLFYEDEIPPQDAEEAMRKLALFISEGEEDDGKPHPKLMDWEQDSKEIIADVNRVAGKEIRSVPYMHWWTFLSFFRSIGEGQLSALVSIRKKKATGQKLDKWEQEFYKEHRKSVDFKQKYTPEEEAEKKRLLALLGD